EAGRTYRIGHLAGSPRTDANNAALIDELNASGFVEGKNLAILSGSYGVALERLAETAALFVRAGADVIVCNGDQSALAAQRATTSISIVATSPDMVGAGLVKSLARPGGNITGINIPLVQLDGKRQDILLDAVPSAKTIAILADGNITSAK